MVSEATALPTVLHNHCPFLSFSTKTIAIVLRYDERMVYEPWNSAVQSEFSTNCSIGATP